MTLRRALPLVLALAAVPSHPALAQWGMPGVGTGAQPSPPPEACRQLLVTRDEVQKYGTALRAAGQRRAQPEEACPLFKAFLASETKMIEGLEAHKSSCGVPDEVIRQLKGLHAQAQKSAKQVCDAAGRQDRPPVLDWKTIPDWGPRRPSPLWLRLARSL